MKTTFLLPANTYMWGGRSSETGTLYLLLLPQAPSSAILFLQAIKGRGMGSFLSLEEMMKKNFLYPFLERKRTVTVMELAYNS